MQKAGFKPAFLLQYEVCLAFIVRWSGAVQGFCQLEIWCKQKPTAVSIRHRQPERNDSRWNKLQRA